MEEEIKEENAEISAEIQPKKVIGRPFKPGQSGNPAGRPKGSLSLVGLMKKRLEMLGPDQRRTIAEHLIDNIMQDALDGKDTQLKLLLNYVEGMPKQGVELSGDWQPIQITIVKKDDTIPPKTAEDV